MKERQTWLQKQPGCLGMPPLSATRGELRSKDSKEGRACMLGGFSYVRLFATPWTVAHQDTQGLFWVPDTMDGLLKSSEALQAPEEFYQQPAGPREVKYLAQNYTLCSFRTRAPWPSFYPPCCAWSVVFSKVYRNTSLLATPSEGHSGADAGKADALHLLGRLPSQPYHYPLSMTLSFPPPHPQSHLHLHPQHKCASLTAPGLLRGNIGRKNNWSVTLTVASSFHQEISTMGEEWFFNDGSAGCRK